MYDAPIRRHRGGDIRHSRPDCRGWSQTELETDPRPRAAELDGGDPTTERVRWSRPIRR